MITKSSTCTQPRVQYYLEVAVNGRFELWSRVYNSHSEARISGKYLPRGCKFRVVKFQEIL